MIAIWSFIKKWIQEIQNMRIIAIEFVFVGFVFLQWINPIRMISIRGNFLQYLNLSWLTYGLLSHKKPTNNVENFSLSLPQRNYRIWSLWPAKQLKNDPIPIFESKHNDLSEFNQYDKDDTPQFYNPQCPHLNCDLRHSVCISNLIKF